MYSEIHVTDIAARAASPDVSLLLTLYESCKGDADRPSDTQFGPDQLGPLYDSCAVVEPLGEDDFIYLHYGPQIAAITGFDMTGRRVSSFKGDTGGFFMRVYHRAALEGRPILTLHRATYAPHVHLWERLILPVRRRDGRDRLYVLIKVREFRLDLLSTLLDAMDRGIFALRFVRGESGEVQDAQIMVANREASRITGRPVQELVGARMLDLFPGLVPKGIWSRYLWVAATRRSTSFEVDYRGDGVQGDFEVRLTPLGDGVMVTFSERPAQALREAGQLARIRELEAEIARLKRQVPPEAALPLGSAASPDRPPSPPLPWPM